MTNSLYLAWNQELYRADKTVGNYDRVKVSGVDTAAMTSLNGNLYAVQSGYLTAINPANGVGTQIGSPIWTGTASLAVLNGSLYIYEGFGIYRFTNLSTGSYQRVGGIDWTGVTAMAGVDSVNRLFVIKNSLLYYVTTSGTAKQLGSGASWGGVASMATIGDTLYIARGVGIWKISGAANLETGSYARVGGEDWTGATNLTALDGQLYLIQNGYLHRVDPGIGNYTVLGRQEWPGTVVMAALP